MKSVSHEAGNAHSSYRVFTDCVELTYTKCFIRFMKRIFVFDMFAGNFIITDLMLNR